MYQHIYFLFLEINYAVTMKLISRLFLIFIKTKMSKTFLMLAISIVLLYSCNSKYSANADKSIFKYNESSGLVNLDPAFARDQAHIWVCNQLYNSLVQLDDSLRIRPSIAKSWTISPNGKQYVFHLRTDVFFHEDDIFPDKSRKVTADDFVYSFNRLLSPGLASPGAWTLAGIARGEDGKYAIKAINDSVLQIDLKQAFPPFLGILSMQYCSVIPHEAVEFYGSSFGRHPIGTGPFYLKNWVEAVKLVLRKNDNYFETENGHRLPYLDAVSITFVIDKMTSFLELVKGNIDFMSGLDATYKDEIINRDGSLKQKYSKDIFIVGEPYLNTEYLGILVDSNLVQDSPLKSLEIRKAINYGFSRNKMIKFLRNNIGSPGTAGIIPAGMLYYSDTVGYGYDYNPALSIELLNEAGYFNLDPKPEIKLVTTSDYLDLCKYVQSQLGELGMNIQVEVSPAAAMREMKATSKLDFFRASWIADYPDAENYLSLFYSRNFAPNGPNYTHFSDKNFDLLYEKAMREIDDDSRMSLYREMDSIIMQNSPVIVLYYDQSLRFVRKNISGMTSNPINLLNLKHIRKY
jgi:peptide/nickel transport system substrate-binding protein